MPQQPLNNFQQQQQQHIWSNNGAAPQQNQPPPVNFTVQIESINAQQMKLRDQIMQSEKNLQAQHQVIKAQRIHFASKFALILFWIF